MEDEAVGEQYVRLIQIASHAQLQLMLEPGAESCAPEAALYLRVAETCPVYWTRWNAEKTNADLDVCCDIPQRGTRENILEKVEHNTEGGGGVKVRHVRNKPEGTSSGNEVLYISPDCGRIVGAPTFGSQTVDAVEGGAAVVAVDGAAN